uniref:PAS domain-containing protein n=1 Tax=Sphingobium phenoxybenzoativorans TaxID=1592790 RepID=UPI000AC0227D
MAGQGAAPRKDDIIALTAQQTAWGQLPLILLAAAGCAAIIWFAVGEAALAAGFAATLIGAGALAYIFTRNFSPPSADADAVPDWTIARAAADASGVAIAITDRAGRLVCASDLYGEWFPGYPAPPHLPVDEGDADRLSSAGRAGWRDGTGRVEGVGKGALRIDADISRTGRSDDYLLWRFTPVKHASILDDFNRLLTGDAGWQLSEAGVMAAMIGGEGRVRAANGAFLLRAAGRIDANVAGRDFASYLRVDGKGQVFFAREERGVVPIRLLQVPLKPGSTEGPRLILLIDEKPGGAATGDGTSALSYIETLLSLLPFGLAMADRDGRVLFLNDAFARAAGVKPGEK